MKRNSVSRSSIKQILADGLLVGCCLGAAPILAQDNGPIDSELQALLTKHDQALINQDLAAVVGTYTPGLDAVLLGTGPGERWIGQQQIKDAYQHYFADFDRGTMTIDCGSRASGTRGDLAWLAAVCTFSDSLNGQKRAYGVNITAVAEKQNGAWRFRTFHFSNLTGNDSPQQASTGNNP